MSFWFDNFSTHKQLPCGQLIKKYAVLTPIYFSVMKFFKLFIWLVFSKIFFHHATLRVAARVRTIGILVISLAIKFFFLLQLSNLVNCVQISAVFFLPHNLTIFFAEYPVMKKTYFCYLFDSQNMGLRIFKAIHM